MRLCTKCKTLKEEVEFRKRSKTKNTGTCKVCTSIAIKRWSEKNKQYKKDQAKIYREENRERLLESGREYYINNKEKAKQYNKDNKERITASRHKYYCKNKEKIVARAKAYKENNKEHVKLVNVRYKKRYKENNREKIIAQTAVSNAIRDGRLVRGNCVMCELNGIVNFTKIEGHHEDYNKPLDVVWVCRKHHQHIHNGKL